MTTATVMDKIELCHTLSILIGVEAAASALVDSESGLTLRGATDVLSRNPAEVRRQYEDALAVW